MTAILLLVLSLLSSPASAERYCQRHPDEQQRMYRQREQSAPADCELRL